MGQYAYLHRRAPLLSFGGCLVDIFVAPGTFIGFHGAFIRAQKRREAHAPRLFDKAFSCPSLPPTRLADGLGPRSVLREAFPHDSPQAPLRAEQWFPRVTHLDVPHRLASNFG